VSYPDDDGYIVLVRPMTKPGDFASTHVITIATVDTPKSLGLLVRPIRNLEILQSKLARGGSMPTSARDLSKSPYGIAILRYIFDTSKVEINTNKLEKHLVAAIKQASDPNLQNLFETLYKLEKVDTEPERARPRDTVAWRLIFGNKNEPQRLKEAINARRVVRLIFDLTTKSSRMARTLCIPLRAILMEAEKSKTLKQDEVTEVLAYTNELMADDKQQAARWVLPLVTIAMRPDDLKEVDVITITLASDGVCIRLLECTKSDASNKALNDYSKLIDLKNYLNSKRFADLTVDTKVIGASKVAKDFLSIDLLYKSLPSDKAPEEE